MEIVRTSKVTVKKSKVMAHTTHSAPDAQMVLVRDGEVASIQCEGMDGHRWHVNLSNDEAEQLAKFLSAPAYGRDYKAAKAAKAEQLAKFLSATNK